jgi:PAS domain S-box-containing protein
VKNTRGSRWLAVSKTIGTASYEAGEPQFMHVCFKPEWRDGKVVGVVGASINITGLKRAEAALRESERQLRLVTDNAPVGIIHCDTELRYKFINRYHARRLKGRLGLTPDQVIGRRVPEVLGDELFAIVEPYVRECLAGNAVDPDRRAAVLASPLRAGVERQQSVGLVSAGTDITGLRRAETAVRESEAVFVPCLKSAA